ncbi:MAG: hypothetical protein QGG40_15020 [Myxococcota bacterium]|jgi:hypothetical protein|nr:hypothetical protein [Myxococcota bacterium]
MARYELKWIDKDAEVGPIFQIGDHDIYHRERPGQRVVRLDAISSPNLDYLEPAVEAFRELAIHWNSPIIFVINPDVKNPPAARFLYEWSQAAHQNGSVDQSFMLMTNVFTHVLGRLVCRGFCSAGMPFDAIAGRPALDAAIDELNTATNWPDWAIVEESTALVVRKGVGEGAYGQLFTRLFNRLRGKGETT